ncbi:WYL domain-containing protein [Clostridium botulinum]|nr:WYL domain-containing protein [Clostridium botulinum]
MDADKNERILSIYERLVDGYVINKYEESVRYSVNERTIQRDIEEIKKYVDKKSHKEGLVRNILYDRQLHGYKLENVSDDKLTNSEILAISKILLESRAFTKDEMMLLIDKLLNCCLIKKNQKVVKGLIANEKYHYIEPHHKTKYLDKLWVLGNAIQETRQVEIEYLRLKDKKTVRRRINPLAIMFSEFYFYIVAFIDDEEIKKDFNIVNDSYPTIYRVDRIKDIKILDTYYKIPYSSRFEEGEFRKRIQFMFGGKLKKIKFWYKGLSIESVLDRLPTAKILKEEENKFLIEAEVFGDGIDMWIRSQGSNVELIESGEEEIKII